jgi:hypothetical protein
MRYCRKGNQSGIIVGPAHARRGSANRLCRGTTKQRHVRQNQHKTKTTRMLKSEDTKKEAVPQQAFTFDIETGTTEPPTLCVCVRERDRRPK